MTFPRFGAPILRVEGSTPSPTLNGWELMEDITVAVAAAAIDITGLDGDTDEMYMLIISSLAAAGGGQNLDMRFNGDGGANYNNQQSQVNGGAHTAFRALGATAMSLAVASEDASSRSIFRCIMRVASGRRRGNVLETLSGRPFLVGRMFAQEWTNTVANLTAINLIVAGGDNFGVGTRVWLYRPSR